MFVPDELHEFGGGNGKALIVHLFRMCEYLDRQKMGVASPVSVVNARLVRTICLKYGLAAFSDSVRPLPLVPQFEGSHEIYLK